jgi:hypothetical protein
MPGPWIQSEDDWGIQGANSDGRRLDGLVNPPIKFKHGHDDPILQIAPDSFPRVASGKNSPSISAANCFHHARSFLLPCREELATTLPRCSPRFESFLVASVSNFPRQHAKTSEPGASCPVHGSSPRMIRASRCKPGRSAPRWPGQSSDQVQGWP